MVKKTQIATFAAGCFWHVQESFDRLNGVESTTVGYIGGKVEKPVYKNVCSGNTGHVEAVQVVFNPRVISYEQLLEVFWKIHNPTTKDRQGLDIGKQYNSMIFYHNASQRKAAEKSKKALQKTMDRKIVTEIKKAPKFWPAEEYHQKYYEKSRIF